MARRRSSSDDLIARSQEEIRARLAEIEPLVAERDRLERALEALEGVTGSRSAQPLSVGRRPPTVVAGPVGAQPLGERRVVVLRVARVSGSFSRSSGTVPDSRSPQPRARSGSLRVRPQISLGDSKRKARFDGPIRDLSRSPKERLSFRPLARPEGRVRRPVSSLSPPRVPRRTVFGANQPSISSIPGRRADQAAASGDPEYTAVSWM